MAVRLIERTLTSLVLFLILGIPSTATSAFAQQAAASEDQRIYEVRTRDGVRYVGYLQVDTPERVVIRTPGGAVIEIPRANIASITEAEGALVGQDFRQADTNPTHLFFGPTGRSLKRGEGYVGVYELFMPFVQVGVTDRFSIGGGTPLIIGGGGRHPFWVTPKFQLYEAHGASVSVGALHSVNVGDGTFGVAYAAGTFGTRDNAVTVAVGKAYYNDNRGNEGSLAAMFGGEHRLSRRLKIITENYVFTGGGFLSGGVRFLGESLSADVGLITPIGNADFLVFPIVNVVWRFR